MTSDGIRLTNLDSEEDAEKNADEEEETPHVPMAA